MKRFAELANPWVAGLPVYEPGRPVEEVARELGIEDVAGIVKLASNENALGPSPRAVEAMHAAAGSMHRYPDGGAFYLKRALSSRLGVRPTEIVPGTGSNELLELLGHVFLNPGASLVMAEGAFVVYRLIAAACRASVVAVPMRDHVHDLPAMAEAIRDDTRIVFVSNPNNPSGTMVDQDIISAFMARVPEHVVVCFDEAYIELLEPEVQPDTLSYVREGRRVVVLRTFSKTYGLAGLRIGYAVAPEECTALLNRVRQPFNVNAMAMAAAEAALDDEEHVARTRKLVKEGLASLTAACDRLGLDYIPSVANFMLIRLGVGDGGPASGRDAFEALQKLGVIVRPMDGYGLPDYVRVTVGTAPENEALVKGMEKVLSSGG